MRGLFLSKGSHTFNGETYVKVSRKKNRQGITLAVKNGAGNTVAYTLQRQTDKWDCF